MMKNLPMLLSIILLLIQFFPIHPFRNYPHFGYRGSKKYPLQRISLQSSSSSSSSSIPNKPSITITTPITAQLTTLMVDLWKAVAYPDENSLGKEFLLKDYSLQRNQVKGFLNHFQFCKDCAIDNSFLMATQNSDGEDILYLTYVSFRLLSESEEDEDESWGNFDPKLLLGKNEINETTGENTTEIGSGKDTQNLPIFPIEEDNQVILFDTKHWVEKIIAQFGVCPFTIDSNRAGIPLGGVRYRVARAVTPDEAFLCFWEEVQLIQGVKEKEISTTLLVFPEIELFGNYELFEFYCECLNDALSASSLNLESDIQLVFFHPKFNFRDGKDRIMNHDDNTQATNSCLNYARRSPWPMVNILRTNQVRSAQKGIPTGLVYQQNDERLSKVGGTVLQNMLVARDWKDMPIIEEGRLKLHPSGEKEKRAINLQNPLLTAFSPATKGCPFHSGSNHETTSINKEEIQEKIVTTTPTQESVPSVDYLQLADEVDSWLNNELLD